jgi:hypothetical protein
VSKGFHAGSANIHAGRKLVVHPFTLAMGLSACQGIEAIDLLDLILEVRKLSYECAADFANREI